MYISLLTCNLRGSDALRYAEESVGLFPRSIFIYICLFSYVYISCDLQMSQYIWVSLHVHKTLLTRYAVHLSTYFFDYLSLSDQTRLIYMKRDLCTRKETQVCRGVSKYGSPFTYISLVCPAICARI